MKKTDYILIGLVLVIIIGAIFSTRGTKAQEAIEFPLKLSGKIGSNQVTYNDYKQMVDNNENFIIIIERAGCGYCQVYMSIVKEVADEKKVAINYIDTDTLTQEEYNALATENDYLKKNRWGTPTTLFMQGSRVIDSIDGYVEKDTFEKFLDGRVILGE